MPRFSASASRVGDACSERYRLGIATPRTLSVPERRGRERGGERGVDAARQAEHDAREAALAHVVAQAEHERAVRRLLVGPATGRRTGAAPDAGRRAGPRARRSTSDVLLELGAAQRSSSPSGVDANRVAVEDQLVVAADLVDVEEIAAVLDALPASISRRRTSGLASANGLAEILMSRSAPGRGELATRDRGGRGACGQTSSSFQTSSQIVTPSRTSPHGIGDDRRAPGSK